MQERLTMLVVDDVEVNRASLKVMFSDEYEVLEAENGEDALVILRERKVDIVILDVFMPAMGGEDVLAQMKADSALRDIPVIVKTAIDENMEVQMLEKGADEFIFSPCEPTIIKKRVKNIVEKYVFRQAMLKKKIEEERHVSRVRERFMMRVSSEMKQDIESILSLCEEGMQGEKEISEDCFSKIREHASHMLTMAEDVIGQTQKDHDEQLLHMMPFQFSDVVEELEQEYEILCQKKGIAFALKNCDITYDYLVGDGKKLKQIWNRMLKKAYNNTVPGGHISTNCVQRKTGKNQVEVEIVVRGDIGASDAYPITESIVELMRGSMIVEDEEGRGILSVITLPFRIGKAPVRRSNKLGNMRVLLLDDNELKRQHHVAMLMRLGVQCDTATNGADAAIQLRNAFASGKGYDIFFINWYIMGAADIVREIRGMYPRERMVIASSTNEKDVVGETMKEAGVDYIMERPVYQSSLYHLLTGICKNADKNRITDMNK